MTNVSYLYDTVEKAAEMGVPSKSILAAMSFAAFPDASWPDLARIELGNGTAFEMKLDLLAGGKRVLVSIVREGAYPFQRDGSLLHWSYVHEKFGLPLCDSVALTCFLGVALQRPVAVTACSCSVHCA